MKRGILAPSPPGPSKELFGVEPRTLGLRDITGRFVCFFNLIGNKTEKGIKAIQDITEYPLPSLKK